MITTSENLKGVSGIYCIIHRDSGMCYVGSSVNIQRRYRQHLREARGTKSSMLLHRALRHFGADSFDFQVLEWCSQDKLLEREYFYIVLLNSASLDGFNTERKPRAVYDKNVSDTTRERLRQAHAGKTRVPLSPEHRAKLSQAGKGHTMSQERRAKISASLKGKPLPAITIQKLTGRIGHVPSEETRAKLREAARNMTPEHKARISEGKRREWATRKRKRHPALDRAECLQRD